MTDVTNINTIVTVANQKQTVTVPVVERVVETNIEGTVIVTGMMGPPGVSSSISQSSDVDLTGLTNGATLVYSSGVQKWQATNQLDNQIMNGGFF